MKIKIIFVILIFLMCGCSKKELHEYSKELKFFDSIINIKLYTTKDKADNIFDYIENTINDYENIINKEDVNSEVSYIYNNNLKDKKIKISNNMNDLIEYGIKLYNDSNGYLRIGNINEIKLNNNVIDNNHVNLNFDQFIKGYINILIQDYLKNMNINYYFINTDSEVIAGNNVNNKDYVVAITNPFNDDILKVFNIQNKYITTKYNSMISVTVLGDDIYISELVANLLLINDYDTGVSIANKYKVKAIWCYKENNKEVIKSNMEEF